MDFFRYKFGNEKAIDLLAATGADCIDYSLFSMVNKDDIFNSDGYIEHAKHLKEYANNKGITINQTHAPFTFNWKHDDFNEVIMPSIIRSLEVSGMLGAEYEVIHPLHHYTYKGHEEEIYIENMKYFRSLIPYCKEYNIKIAIENMYQPDPQRKYMSYDVCSTPEEFCRYIDDLDSEYIAGCLDIGHAALIINQEPQDFIRKVGADRIRALHVHDVDYIHDNHTLPGLCKLNWREIMKALDEIHYKGDFTYEANNFVANFDNEYIPQASKFMVDTAKFLINLTNL